MKKCPINDGLMCWAKTEAGKAVSKTNAYKHVGYDLQMKALRKFIADCKRGLLEGWGEECYLRNKNTVA